MPPSSPTWRRLVGSGLALVAVLALGTVGYILLEGWDLADALYMTVITVATVGYGETRPLDPAGRWFTIGLILGGIGVLTYGLTSITAFVVEGELADYLRKNRMDKQIEKLSGHYVVCGAGRIGRNIADELRRLGRAVVVVDRDAASLASLETALPGVLVLEGDATDDSVLLLSGIQRAAGLGVALSSDADCLFVVVSARQLVPQLRIITRVDNETNVPKMLRAGADKTVSAAHIGGLRIASELRSPAVVDFLDRMMREKDGSIRMDEATLAPGNGLVGMRLHEARIPNKVGCVVVALRRAEGELVFNPGAHTVLHERDTLIVIGEIDKLRQLRELTG